MSAKGEIIKYVSEYISGSNSGQFSKVIDTGLLDELRNYQPKHLVGTRVLILIRELEKAGKFKLAAALEKKYSREINAAGGDSVVALKLAFMALNEKKNDTTT